MKRISDQIGQRQVEDSAGMSFTPEQRAMLEKISKMQRGDDS